MKELSNIEISAVGAGISASEIAESGLSGAIAGGGFGATVGFYLGGPPGAIVVGGLGGGVGFIGGMIVYALKPR